MKKILFAIAFVILTSVGATAQSDGFFKNNNPYNNRYLEPTSPGIMLPSHNEENDPAAPLGSGLLVLTALGAGYVVSRKMRNR